jgi:hypothetical protein
MKEWEINREGGAKEEEANKKNYNALVLFLY